jgi:hypothetical protein
VASRRVHGPGRPSGPQPPRGLISGSHCKQAQIPKSQCTACPRSTSWSHQWHGCGKPSQTVMLIAPTPCAKDNAAAACRSNPVGRQTLSTRRLSGRLPRTVVQFQETLDMRCLGRAQPWRGLNVCKAFSGCQHSTAIEHPSRADSDFMHIA